MIDNYGTERRQCGDSALIVRAGPFAGNLVRAENALCADGIRRTAFASYDGIADTFFSVPAYVHARHEGKSVRVYGYVTTDGRDEHGNDTVRFVAYLYRKHASAVSHPAREDDNTCLNCGTETYVQRHEHVSSSSRLHVGTDSFLCNVAGYRDGTQRTYAEVRGTQEYRQRTHAETLPIPAEERHAELLRTRNGG